MISEGMPGCPDAPVSDEVTVHPDVESWVLQGITSRVLSGWECLEVVGRVRVRERRGEGQVRGREGAGVPRQVLQSLQRRPLRLYRRCDRAAQHAFPHYPRFAVARNQTFAESGQEAL